MELLIVLLVGVFCGLRYGATDLAAAVKGPESWMEHRAERARMRHELKVARTARGTLTVGEAIAQRIADRASGPRPARSGRPERDSGPLRTFLTEWWTDTWDGAGEQRHRHAERKQAGDLPRQRAARWIWKQTAGPRPEPWTARRLDRDDDPVDADWTPEPDEPPAQTAPDTPAPAWAPVTPIRKDTPMTAASAEITSPEGALAFSEAVQAQVAEWKATVETAVRSLTDLGVTGGPVALFESTSDPLDQLDAKFGEAGAYFRRHIATADTLRADETFGDKQYAAGS